MELSIDRLTKQYQNKIAVDRISLRLNTGIYGLLGANGAGKTTLMRMVCGILKPTSGTITFDGIDVSEERYRSMLGYLPQDFGYYPEFTGEDFLLYMAALKGMRKPQARRKTVELLKLVSLHDVAKKKIKTYSGGMKQRLGIAQALLNQPKLLVLDEPTSALDPIGRKEILDILLKVKERTTVIFSTHILSDVERICDEIAILRDGKIALSGDLSQIKKGHMVDCLEVGMKNKEDFIQFLNIVRDNPNIYEMQKSENTIYLYSNNIEKVQRDVMQGLINQNLYPIYIKIQEPTLERLFMEAIK